jgi:DNA-binding response OmpR family regulator
MTVETGAICIVEDDIDNATIMSMALAAAGLGHLQPHFATNQAEARKILENPSQRMDLIILDLRLQEDNGMNILEEIRQNPQLANTPVLVVTAEPDRESARKRSIELGANGFLGKPFDIDDLTSEVKRILKLDD